MHAAELRAENAHDHIQVDMRRLTSRWNRTAATCRHPAREQPPVRSQHSRAAVKLVPPFLAPCSRAVFKTFRHVERAGERLIGRVGPFFVTLAIVLIGGCTFTFFEVVFPSRFWHDGVGWLECASGTAWCLYLCCMFSFHYYKALTVLPGSPLDRLHPSAAKSRSIADLLPRFLCIGPFAPRSTNRATLSNRARDKLMQSQYDAGVGVGEMKRTCKKCPPMASGKQPPKPERTHHCSVCRTCVLKFDHHCPWINQCVGVHNERYFLLFLLYFSVACGFVPWWAWGSVRRAMLEFGQPWPYFSPRPLVLLLFVLALVMCIAVGIMGLYQLYIIAAGETAVETHDNEWYRKAFVNQGKVYRNPFDLGRRRNLWLFFNLDSHYWTTIFLPVSVEPYSDGWTWEKRVGWEESKMDRADELTDEEQFSDNESP